MDIDSEEQSSERVELHFLAALVDELMKTLHANHTLSRDQLQQLEVAVSDRIGTEPRAW
jgi:hypothetical protein